MNFLLADKVETALAAIVDPVVNITVYTGKSSDEKGVPCVICSADIAEPEDPPGSGNYFIDATVAVKQSAVQNEDGSDPNATAPKTAAQTITAAVFGALMVSDLATQLTAATGDLRVFEGSVHFGAAECGRDETGLWLDMLRIRMYGCGAALT